MLPPPSVGWLYLAHSTVRWALSVARDQKVFRAPSVARHRGVYQWAIHALAAGESGQLAQGRCEAMEMTTQAVLDLAACQIYLTCVRGH